MPKSPIFQVSSIAEYRTVPLVYTLLNMHTVVWIDIAMDFSILVNKFETFRNGFDDVQDLLGGRFPGMERSVGSFRAPEIFRERKGTKFHVYEKQRGIFT